MISRPCNCGAITVVAGESSMNDETKAPSEAAQEKEFVSSTGENGSGGSASLPPVNGRPQNVAKLVMGAGEISPHWFAENRRANRFYVVNLPAVVGQMKLEHTKSAIYFQKAAETIAQDTSWKQQFDFEYKSSHTQIFPRTGNGGSTPQTAKLFGHAATIIVAMELAAREKRPDLNVYDHLRVLAAHFFVDHFTPERLAALSTYHGKLSTQERVQKFGAEAAEFSFEKTCLAAIEQYDGRLLQQLTQKYCVTHHTATKLVEFVNTNYPAELHVGPVRSSGDNAASIGLGTKNAAKDFRAPRNISQSELPPCF